jgi:hypothetical protein
MSQQEEESMKQVIKIISAMLIPVIFLGIINGCSKDQTEEPTGNNWLPITENVNGEIFEIQGARILRVWGTPYEQGYANAYLNASDIYDVIIEACESNNLTDEILQSLYPLLDEMVFPAHYEQELRGMLAGLNSRAGGAVYIPPIGRNLTFNDYFIGHILKELNDVNCSSFTAWGLMTEDGGLIGGVNKDWIDSENNNVRRDKQMIIIRIPDADSGRFATLCVDEPGSISGCKAINEEGLFAKQHDSNSRPRTVNTGFMQDDLFYREVVETMGADATGTGIRNLLLPYITNDGTNMMVGMPYNGSNMPSYKFELDGDESYEGGISIWKPEVVRPYLVCTSHFRERLTPPPPEQTGRFTYMTDILESVFNSAGTEHVTIQLAWEILQNTRLSEYNAVLSIVYEPNKMLMHYAFFLRGETINDVNVGTLDLKELFNR